MKKVKENKGITLVALIITVIILLILAGISLNLVIGENGIIEKSKMAGKTSTREGIRESLEMEVARSYDDDVTLDAQKLKNNIMEEFPNAKIIGDKFPIIVIIQGYAYEIDENGKVEYLGKEEELIDKTEIKVDPTENMTPELVQKVNVTVKTALRIKNDDVTLVYAWSNNENTKPEENKYKKAQLIGDAKNKTAKVASNDTEEGNYYLWLKIIIGEKEIEKKYGPYAIKDHTTLVSCTSEPSSSSAFLGGSITRNTIESVTIETSVEGHKASDDNCWDVSSNKSEKYLAWYEDKDNDGYYEVTIAGEGGVAANSDSSCLFTYIGYNGDDTTVFYGIENLDTGLVINMDSMFYGSDNVTNLDLSNFDTSNVTNMNYMLNCESLTNLNIRNFDTSNVTDMSYMFYECNNLISLDLSNFDTSNVTDMHEMFENCSSLTDLDLSNFNPNNVTDMSYMFNNCSGLTSLNLSNFDKDGGTLNREGMFNNCSRLINLDLSNSEIYKTKDIPHLMNVFNAVPSNIKIKTNSNTAKWLKEKFTKITDANIELVS